MPGQINRGTLLGDLIFEIVSLPDVKTIIEIGTWNGQGSTRCVLDGLKRKDIFKFISIESSPIMHASALRNVPSMVGVELWLGRIIDPEDIPKRTLNERQKGWLAEDLDNYRKIPNVLEKIPQNIDLIIFDGGEFTSEMEFNLIGNRARHIILDDTNTATGSIKFATIRNKIVQGRTTFTVVQEQLNDRNGWIYAKRKGI
jgi:hypothetical protein